MEGNLVPRFNINKLLIDLLWLISKLEIQFLIYKSYHSNPI